MGQVWVACVYPRAELLNYTFYGWQSRWIHTISQWFHVWNVCNFLAQYVVTCLWIALLVNAYCSSLYRVNRLVSERTNGKMKSTMLIKIIYQKVCATITNHLEYNNGEYKCAHTHVRENKIEIVEATGQCYTIWHRPLYRTSTYTTLSCHFFLSKLSQQFYLIPWKLWFGSKMP